MCRERDNPDVTSAPAATAWATSARRAATASTSPTVPSAITDSTPCCQPPAALPAPFPAVHQTPFPELSDTREPVARGPHPGRGAHRRPQTRDRAGTDIT